MAEVSWSHDRCIVCLAQKDLTVEHIIPRQIGGRLTARFLCKPCNDQLGHRVEADVRADPSIRLAAENLQDQIPDLAKAIREGQTYVASGPGGRAMGTVKRGKFQIDGAMREKGSVVQPTPEACKHLQRVLAKRGLDPNAIQQLLGKFEEAPDNTVVKLGLDLHAIRWGIDEIHPVLEGPFLSPAVLAKIAYEFLACHDGDLILSESPQVAGLRAVVRGDSEEAIQLEWLTSRRYRPLHGLAMEQCSDHTVVRVCLFGWLVCRVHLRTVGLLSRPYFIYTCELDTGEEYCAELPNHQTG